MVSFNVCVRYFVWNFKGILWNYTRTILPIHWKMCILFTGENFRALSLRFKSSSTFLKHPPGNGLLPNMWQFTVNLNQSWSKIYDAVRPQWVNPPAWWATEFSRGFKQLNLTILVDPVGSNIHMTGPILGLRPAKEIQRYFVTTPFIGWVQA